MTDTDGSRSHIRIHIPDWSNINLTPFPLPPRPRTEALARKSKSIKHQKSFNATFAYCGRPTTSILQIRIDESSTYVNMLSLETASDLGFQTFCKFYENYLQVFQPLFLLKFFKNVNLKILNQTIHQHPLLKESLILLVPDQDRFNHRLHLVKDQY